MIKEKRSSRHAGYSCTQRKLLILAGKATRYLPLFSPDEAWKKAGLS
jgi:hypothetical protein